MRCVDIEYFFYINYLYYYANNAKINIILNIAFNRSFNILNFVLCLYQTIIIYITMKLTRCYRIIFYGLCIALFMYQSIQLIQSYLSFTTSISIDYINSSYISLPGITLCIDKYYLLDSKKVDQLNISDSIRSDRWKMFQYMATNMTIEEQNNVLISNDHSLDCLASRTLGTETNESNNFDRIVCQSISPMKVSLDYPYKCFTFFNQMDNQSMDMFVIDYITKIVTFGYHQIIEFELSTKIKSALVYFHSRDEPMLRWTVSNSIGIFWNNRISYIIYKKIIVESLPRPFNTDCYDYSEKSYRSREHCLASCGLNQFLRRKREWPLNYIALNLSSNLFFEDITKRNYTMEKEIGQICKIHCGLRIDCRREIYEMRKDYFENEFSIDDNYIMIMPPFVPDQIVRYTQKMSFEEMICFVGSLFSLYFGFSVIMLSNVNSSILNFIYKKILIKLKLKCLQFKNNFYWQDRSVTNVNININSPNAITRQLNV